MSTKDYQKGDVVDYTAGADVASGEVVAFGKGIGVAQADIANGEVGALAIAGVHKLAKKTSQAFAAGDPLYWDFTPGELTTTAANGVRAGIAAEASGSSDTEAYVKLDQGQAGQIAYQADTTAADLAALKVDFNLLLTKMKAAGAMAQS